MEIQRLNKELEIYKKFADEERESEKKKEWTQKISENTVSYTHLHKTKENFNNEKMQHM